MNGPLYHFLVVLPIFAVVLLFFVLPPLQWLSERLFDRKFVLRFSGVWSAKNVLHRWDVAFSVFAFLVSMGVSFLILDALINMGILPPLN